MDGYTLVFIHTDFAKIYGLHKSHANPSYFFLGLRHTQNCNLAIHGVTSVQTAWILFLAWAVFLPHHFALCIPSWYSLPHFQLSLT